MPEPSLINSYLAAMRRLLNARPAEIDRILEETEDHLSRAVLDGVEAGLTLREAEERAISRFGLPGEVCARFRDVYRPRRRLRSGAVAAILLGMGAAAVAGRLLPAEAGLVPIVLGLLPAYFSGSARAGMLPAVAACAVSAPLWIWCALVNPGWYRSSAQRPPWSAMGVEIMADLLVMALVLCLAGAGALAGERLRRVRIPSDR